MIPHTFLKIDGSPAMVSFKFVQAIYKETASYDAVYRDVTVIAFQNMILHVQGSVEEAQKTWMMYAAHYLHET